MRILALDLGERRIGVALSDPMGWLATPLLVLKSAGWRADMEAIAGLVEKHHVEQVIVGYPRSLNGTIGPQAQLVDKRVARLRAHLSRSDSSPDGTRQPTPVTLWDERLSTAEAERLTHEAGKRVDRQRIDAAAAAVILQSYLDAQRN
jgi:putative Holliday junction resolvase